MVIFFQCVSKLARAEVEKKSQGPKWCIAGSHRRVMLKAAWKRCRSRCYVYISCDTVNYIIICSMMTA